MEPITNNNIKRILRDYFYEPSEFPPINEWDVSNVTDMTELFMNNRDFNENINDWNVSNVTSMQSLFYGCIEFNQPLDKWNVSNVRDFSSMFGKAYEFNQELNWVVPYELKEQVSVMFDRSGMSEENIYSVKFLKNGEIFDNQGYMIDEDNNRYFINEQTGEYYYLEERTRKLVNPDGYYVDRNGNMLGVTNNNASNVDSDVDYDLFSDVGSYYSDATMDINELNTDHVDVNGVDDIGDEFETYSHLSEEPNEIDENTELKMYNDIVPEPLNQSSVILTMDDKAMDIIMGTEEVVLDYLQQDTNNFAVVFNNKGNKIISIIDKNTIMDIINDHSNVKYECTELIVPPPYVPSLDIIVKDVPYLALRSIGVMQGGLVRLSQIKYILTNNIQAVEIVKDRKIISNASLQMFGNHPDATSASHCQEGQDEFIHNMLVINIQNAGKIKQKRKRTRKNRKTKRTYKRRSKGNKKTHYKRSHRKSRRIARGR